MKVFSWMAPKAGLDKFVGNKFGRVKHARRVQAREGLHPPARLSAGSIIKKPPYLDDMKAFVCLMVPKAGLEPARLAPLPPQDSVSTNSTTSAIND